jgi:hypothetical protein
VKTIALVAVAAAVMGWMASGTGPSAGQKDEGFPANGTVVWKVAGFGLSDGWGINLAGNGTRIQIVPGTSTDIEFADGYLTSAGTIALLPHGEALTYQHCVSAVQQAASQSEPLGEITPTSPSSLCASGSGGDLASIQVTHDDGSSLTVNITVWEYVLALDAMAESSLLGAPAEVGTVPAALGLWTNAQAKVRVRGARVGHAQPAPQEPAGSPASNSPARPCSIAYLTSSTRLCSCSLPSVFCTWFCTVRWDRTSRVAICL